MFTVYVIRSKSTGRLYKGQAENVQQRLWQHETGMARYTRGRGPWELVLREDYQTRAEAMSREKWLKIGKGREWLKAALSGRAGPPEAD